MSEKHPLREIHGDPSSPSPTTAATPHTETQADQNVSGTRNEFHAECEFQFEGGPDLETRASHCQKNPGHTNFIPVQEFLKEENGYFDPKHIDDVRAMADRTVRVVLGKVSADRPDVYPGTSTPFPFRDYKGLKCSLYGTGFIIPWISGVQKKPCPCPSCRTSLQPQMEYCVKLVATAAHVIYNNEEAMETVVELFYDSEDREGVKYLYGISVSSDAVRDYSIVKCVTHCRDLGKTLQSVDRLIDRIFDRLNQTTTKVKALMISHPHGLSKHVSVGNLKHLIIKSQQADENNSSSLTVRLPVGSPDVLNELLPGVVEVPVPYGRDNSYRYFELPRGAKVIMPTCVGCKENIYHHYTTIPAGSQLELPGGELVDLPSKAGILQKDLRGLFGYDTSTCPGSSGAPILELGEEGYKLLLLFLIHSGVLGDTNISCNSDGALLI